MSTNFYFQTFVNNAQQYFAITPEASFPIIWIFTEGEGDGIESRLPFKIFKGVKIKTRESHGF